MVLELKPGSRLRCSSSTTEVIVVKAPSSEVDLRCGGQPMVPFGQPASSSGLPDASHASGTLLGKRYADSESGLEVLCVKAGDGSLSLGDEPLHLRDAKPLPSSD